MSHGDLVRLASKGDRQAWSELLARFGPLVHATARRSGLNHSDAADVAQITWLRLLRSLDRLLEPERLPAWLVTTARRESLRTAMKSARNLPCAEPLESNVRGGPVVTSDVYSVEGDFDPVVELALSRLPSRYQQLIRLLMSDAELSYAEVASHLGVAVGSIGPMRLRCLQLLRQSPELAAAV